MIQPKAQNTVEASLQRLLAVLNETLARSNRVHLDFLNQQAQSLQAIAAGMAGKMTIARQSVINRRQLQEFGSGSIAKCFGPEYAVLDQRKSPRIPNGDLLMVDRVTAISGERGLQQPPADITTEFDISPAAWFVRENLYGGLPLAAWMEIALQPCGILSAYLGTSLSLPADVNIFRNLDGVIDWLACPPPAGKTITNRARLVSSVSGAGMLIQKFVFELSEDGAAFLTGESSFGYFQQAAMERQSGLDAEANPQLAYDFAGFQRLPAGGIKTQEPHLDLVDELRFKESAGRFKNGLITGSRRLDGAEWFYQNHFYQDPVMPGSLGVEAILQGLWIFMRHFNLDAGFKHAAIDFSHSSPLKWKYRGQVTPANRAIHFSIHLKNDPFAQAAQPLFADADFWVEDRKIYSIENISITLKEGRS